MLSSFLFFWLELAFWMRAFIYISFSSCFCSASALICHFSIFLIPLISWTSLISGKISESCWNIGTTMKDMKPDWPPAIRVVCRSHSMETSRPCAFSRSPWVKNSSKSRSAHWVLSSNSRKEVLMSQACRMELETSYLLSSIDLGLLVSIRQAVFCPFSIWNRSMWVESWLRRFFISAMSVCIIVFRIRFRNS